MPTSVGCHARVAGVWQPCRPHVRNGGFWKECQKVHVKAGGVWEVVYADNARSLSLTNTTISNVDFLPGSLGAGWRMKADGGIDTFDNPPDANFAWGASTDWLKYDTGIHVYELFFLQNGAHSLDVVPTFGIPLSTISTHQIYTTRSSAGDEFGEIEVSFYDDADQDPKPRLGFLTVNLSISLEDEE